MADELLRELAPLLAEEGIDVSDIDVPDLDTLQQALNRAVERHNMAVFTPRAPPRTRRGHLRLAAEAIADGDTALAAAVLDQAQPESRRRSRDPRRMHRPDPRPPRPVAIRDDTSAPPGLAGLTQLPAGNSTGERAARDILTLARKGRAFASLDALIARQGGQHVLYGSALVLAAALQAWARHADTTVIDLGRTVIC